MERGEHNAAFRLLNIRKIYTFFFFLKFPHGLRGGFEVESGRSQALTRGGKAWIDAAKAGDATAGPSAIAALMMTCGPN